MPDVPDSTDLVPFYDIDTKRLVRIPRCELAPKCVEALVEGIEGLVWVRIDQLKMDGPIFHPPFDESKRATLRTIQETFREFHPLSLEEWEDGFRRDVNADREIALWTHAADVYRELVADEPSIDRRLGIMMVVVTAMTVSPENIRSVLPPVALSDDEIANVIRRYHAT